MQDRILNNKSARFSGPISAPMLDRFAAKVLALCEVKDEVCAQFWGAIRICTRGSQARKNCQTDPERRKLAN